MVERQQHKEKQKQQQQELLSGQVDQYQTTSVHVGPHKQDKIYSVQRETLKDGLKHIQESYDKIYHVYNREFLTTSDKYGKKNALQILIRLVSVQLAIEDSLLIPMAHDLLEDGYRWSETCRNGIFAMKDAMITLWRSIGTSEFTDETDQLTKQLFEQRLKKHSDIIVQSIVPLLSDKLTAMQRDEMFHLMSNAQSQERHFPISSELKMNWLSGHDMNLFEKFVENVKKEAHTMEKTVYTPKLGYHKWVSGTEHENLEHQCKW